MKKQFGLLLLLGAIILPMKNSNAGLALVAAGPASYGFYEASLLPLGYGLCAMNGECGGNKVAGFLSTLLGIVLLDGESGVEPSFSEITEEDAIAMGLDESEVQDIVEEFNESLEEVNIQKRNITRSILKMKEVTMEDVNAEWEKREELLSPVVFEVVSRIRAYNSNVEK